MKTTILLYGIIFAQLAALLLAMTDSQLTIMVGGVVSLGLAWMQLRTQQLAKAASEASLRSATAAIQAAEDVRQGKELAVSTNKLVNSGSLVQLEFIEVITRQLAESTGNSRDIEQHDRAMKNVRDHIATQSKVDAEAKEVRANDRLVSQQTVAAAVGQKVDDAIAKKLP